MKPKFLALLLACSLSCMAALGTAGCATGGIKVSGNQEDPQIYLYGEAHDVQAILDRELEAWQEHYEDGMRHLFVELPYCTAEYYNLWMQSDDDEILEACYADIEGTAAHSPSVLEFYKAIKRTCPETIFHGTDVGHQYGSTGARFVEYLQQQGLESSEMYALAQQDNEQGRRFYEQEDDVYRENAMTENFVREFDALGGEPVMGIYGSAHTGLDSLDFTNSVPSMANQLQERYGDIIYVEDLSALS